MEVSHIRQYRGAVAPSALVATLALMATLAGCGAPPGGSPVPEPSGTLPLWEVSAGGDTIHLLGSIHLLRPEAYPLDPAIYEAFDGAEVVAFEIDLSEMAESGPLMMTRGMLPDGRTIADVLPGDLAAELERRAAALALPAVMVKGMKPWFAAMTLSAMVLRRAGFEAAAGIDMHFHERAGATGKRIVGLERLEDQLDALDGLSDGAEAAFLRTTLAQLDSTAAMLDRTTALWKRGDVEGLAALTTASMRGQPELVERLLDRRNRRWVPQIEALLRSGEPAIVIVGVAHLVGDGSVVDLLRERGYTIRRVSAAHAAAADPFEAAARMAAGHTVSGRAVSTRAMATRATAAHAVSGGPVPAHAAPGRTVPARMVPARMVPARTVPARTAPARTAPAHTAPARTAPAAGVARVPVVTVR